MANAKIKVILFSLVLVFVPGCGDASTIQVDLDDPKHRKVYIDLLTKNQMNYKIVENNSILIFGESKESLDEKMKGFEDFVNKEIEEANIKRNKNN